ncbi:MAG TPA: sulfotransferase domain-containing protein [Rubrobacter sp.]
MLADLPVRQSVTRGAKKFLNIAGGAPPAVDEQNVNRAENRKRRRQRITGLKNELQVKRRDLRQITSDIRTARRGADEGEQLEHVKRAKRKQQEIFQLQIGLRAVKEGAEDTPATGALPDFAVIGAAKCGTTFFYHLLTKHPHVEPAATKEIHYFDMLFDEGIEWYRRCFPTPRLKEGRKSITGEGSPSYLFDPRAPERMAGVVPHARLIALLRNPVDRALSAYYHRLRNGQETLTFEETVRAALEGDPDSNRLSRNIYVDHLQRWSDFFSDEQMLVLKSENFFERPRETLKVVFEFLDLPDWEPGASDLGDRLNKGGYEQKMDPATRQLLQEFFEPHNQRLYDYLGIDFGW